MIPAATTTIGSVRKIEDTWASEGISSEVQRWVRSEYRGNGTHVFGEIARAGRVKPATIFRPGKREVRSPFDAVPKAILRRLRAAIAAMGAGLATSTAGLGWDYHVHEIAKEAAKVESILAPPHLLIFAGFAITGLGFLGALVASRFLLVPCLARFARIGDRHAPKVRNRGQLNRRRPMADPAQRCMGELNEAEASAEAPSVAGSLPGPRENAENRIVVARDLVKVYDSGRIAVRALRGVSLDILQGEMVAVMGPSGCGKTTLLNCLSGIDEFTSGEVWIGGRRLSKLGDNEKTDFRAKKVGFVFQSYNLLPVLNAVENVELPLLVLGRDPKESRKRALEVLNAVGIRDQAEKMPMEMSGGQQQRVAIARALVNDPDIVFADEPTGNLDSETSAEVVGLIRRLNQEQGQTFVIVTHDLRVSRETRRIVQMRDGTIRRQVRLRG